MGSHRVRLGCGCGKTANPPFPPQPDTVTTGIEGETGAAQ